MAVQLGTTMRNNRLDQFEVTIGASPTLEIRTLAQPANCAAADTGAALATLPLPSDFMNAASGGTKTLLGSWTIASAAAGGTALHFRIKQGATCHCQGSVSNTGGGGDLKLDNDVIVLGQTVTITAFTLTDGNA